MRGSIYRTVVTKDEVSWHIIVTPDLWCCVPPTPLLPAPALQRHRGRGRRTAPGQSETDGGAHSDYNDAPQSPGHAGCQALPAVSLHCPQESVTAPVGTELRHHAAWPKGPGMGMKIRELRIKKTEKFRREVNLLDFNKMKSLTSSK